MTFSWPSRKRAQDLLCVLPAKFLEQRPLAVPPLNHLHQLAIFRLFQRRDARARPPVLLHAAAHCAAQTHRLHLLLGHHQVHERLVDPVPEQKLLHRHWPHKREWVDLCHKETHLPMKRVSSCPTILSSTTRAPWHTCLGPRTLRQPFAPPTGRLLFTRTRTASLFLALASAQGGSASLSSPRLRSGARDGQLAQECSSPRTPTPPST